jgi:hypothetical protein
MEKGEWITIVGIAVGMLTTTIGSAIYVAFKIGKVSEKVTSLKKSVEIIKQDITLVKQDITLIKIDITEIKVKLNILWKDYIHKPNYKKN